MCFVAPWWSASTCSLISNDPTLKSSLVEDTHTNHIFFMGDYIARPTCRLETRFARINAHGYPDWSFRSGTRYAVRTSGTRYAVRTNWYVLIFSKTNSVPEYSSHLEKPEYSSHLEY